MNKKCIEEYKQVIFHDLECLNLKKDESNTYHYRLLKSNLKDLFRLLKRGVLNEHNTTIQ